jgi:hypothetical protein
MHHNDNDLQNKTQEELAQMAKGIPGISQPEMSKEELIDAIKQHKKSHDPSAPGQGGGQGDTPPQSGNPADWKNQPGNQS